MVETWWTLPQRYRDLNSSSGLRLQRYPLSVKLTLAEGDGRWIRAVTFQRSDVILGYQRCNVPEPRFMSPSMACVLVSTRPAVLVGEV